MAFAPGSIRTGKGDFYTVFTPFYRKWLSQLKPEHLTPLPAPKAQEPNLLYILGNSPLPEIISNLQLGYWPAGEAAAHQKLQDFAEQALNSYDQQRDFPALAGTSQVSAYLAAGVLSSRQCLAAAQMHSVGRFMDKSTGAGVWVSELVWREFYRHLLIGFPRISKGRAFKLPTEKLAWRLIENAKVQRDLQAWQTGQTGFPIIDAAMRQLLETVRRFVPELAHLNNKDIHQPVVGKLTGDLFSNESGNEDGKSSNYPAPIIDLKLSRDRVMQAFEAVK